MSPKFRQEDGYTLPPNTSVSVLMINAQGMMLSVLGQDYFVSYNRVPWLRGDEAVAAGYGLALPTKFLLFIVNGIKLSPASCDGFAGDLLILARKQDIRRSFE